MVAEILLIDDFNFVGHELFLEFMQIHPVTSGQGAHIKFTAGPHDNGFDDTFARDVFNGREFLGGVSGRVARDSIVNLIIVEKGLQGHQNLRAKR
jgi:hypothetical protein